MGTVPLKGTFNSFAFNTDQHTKNKKNRGMKAYFIVFVSLYTLSGNNNNTSFTPSRLSLGCPQPTLDTQKLDIQYVQIRITEYCHTSMHSVWYPKIEHIHRENIIKNGGDSHWFFFHSKWRRWPRDVRAHLAPNDSIVLVCILVFAKYFVK